MRAPSRCRTSSSRFSTSRMICRSRSDKLSSICVVVTAKFGANVSMAFASPTYPLVLFMLTSTRCRTFEFWICVGVGGRRALRPLANFLKYPPTLATPFEIRRERNKNENEKKKINIIYSLECRIMKYWRKMSDGNDMQTSDVLWNIFFAIWCIYINRVVRFKQS